MRAMITELLSSPIVRQILQSLLFLGFAYCIGRAAQAIGFMILRKIARRTTATWDEKALDRVAAPARLLVPLLFLRVFLPAVNLPPKLIGLASHALNILFTLGVSFLLVRIVGILRDLLLTRYDILATDNRSARKMHTQIRILEKSLLSIIAFATLAFVLMTFEGIRQIGVSLLASAGIAGIILGLAAQKSIGTLLAGIQIAITQPISIDDVVIVEGEWGRVEDITLTYVVVRIWDLRRLIVPIQFFLEKPFQNWTRNSAEILGSVFLYLDYSAPLEALRAELKRLLAQSPLWDGKVGGIQVTECREKVVEVRVLVSAANAGDAWDLRCALRESLLAFLQSNHPACLPRVRAEMIAPSAHRPV